MATRVGGNPELIAEDRGIIVTAGDEQALAAEIERLLHDSSMRTALSSNAKKFAEEHFTIAKMRQRYEDLYTDLLERKAGRNPHRAFCDKNRTSTRSLRVAIVAASPRYVGGQSVQADLLLSSMRSDPAIEAHLIPIDPPFPRVLNWVGRHSVPSYTCPRTVLSSGTVARPEECRRRPHLFGFLLVLSGSAGTGIADCPARGSKGADPLPQR